MAPRYATADNVEREDLLTFVRPRHRATLVTRRGDGSPQVSPVTCGVDDEGRIVISTYPSRAKAANLRRDPAATVLVHSDEWDGPYVQVDGTAEVIDLPDWDEYRQAMRDQGKSLIRISVDRWGPVATGGFPPPDSTS